MYEKVEKWRGTTRRKFSGSHNKPNKMVEIPPPHPPWRILTLAHAHCFFFHNANVHGGGVEVRVVCFEALETLPRVWKVRVVEVSGKNRISLDE